ncbi:response regulator [Aquimarina sp. U1-2]|uniref:ATP-binding protein n=1 Tax=Aquimarina sp. U1-2 TaxID=2823141 RepID=UPI001AEC9EFA|nr:ATP-binding protein [Aquimarina sp. U1-2]MBP2833625.1 response regulator [Aquimarina sp. U1-2]
MKQDSWFMSETIKYTLCGIIFGLLFPILATCIDINKLGLEFSWESVKFVQNNDPMHYIIDTAPIFLGLFAMFGGRNLDRLKEKNQEILKAYQYKQDFLANMSHEIRTPMVGVIGMIDLLSRNTTLDTIQQEYVHTIQKSSYNLLEILNQILDLSKMESGKLKLNTTTINFEDILQQCVDLFLATAKAKDVNLMLNHSNEIPKYIIADGHRLSQVISNLIGNAIKFTDKGSIQINTSVMKRKDQKLTIKVEVIDSGIGISKKDQEQIFNRYSQFHEASMNLGIGSGLGLAICNKLVPLMHGELGVHSELGSGSNFWFTFTTKVSSTTPVVSESKTSIGSNQHTYNLHALLVEDSDTSILVSQQILKYLGCTVDIAKNGKEAIALFKEDTYDFILMDINLPDLDGVQTSKLIRKQHAKVPPIFALTSHALPGDADRFITKGLDDYITKPFTTETLNIKLKNWFGEHYDYH